MGLFTGLLSNSVASWVRQSYGILDVGHIVRIKVMVMDREKAGRLERMIVSLQSVVVGGC